MSAPSLTVLLAALLAFQVKHFICDFILQTTYQVENKGFYGRRGGIGHALCHALFSVPVLLILTRAPAVVAGLVAMEFVLHYHIDWLKARTERVRGWTQSDGIYWVAFGADQFAHQVTYIGMAAFAIWPR